MTLHGGTEHSTMELCEALQRYWGYTEFRQGQEVKLIIENAKHMMVPPHHSAVMAATLAQAPQHPY